MAITFEEFIENHVRVATKGEHIKLTPVQYAFLDWLEKCKETSRIPLSMKRRDKI